MRIMALDIGKVRCGIAISDPQEKIATPEQDGNFLFLFNIPDCSNRPGDNHRLLPRCIRRCSQALFQYL